LISYNYYGRTKYTFRKTERRKRKMVSASVFIECHNRLRELENKREPEIRTKIRDPVVRTDYGLVKLTREQLKMISGRSFVGVYDVTTLRYQSSHVDELMDSSRFESEQLESRLSRNIGYRGLDEKTAYTIVDEDSKPQIDGSLLVKNKVVVHSIGKDDRNREQSELCLDGSGERSGLLYKIKKYLGKEK